MNRKLFVASHAHADAIFPLLWSLNAAPVWGVPAKSLVLVGFSWQQRAVSGGLHVQLQAMEAAAAAAMYGGSFPENDWSIIARAKHDEPPGCRHYNWERIRRKYGRRAMV